MDFELQQAVAHAAQRPEVLAAVQQLYADLQHAIDQRQPRCQASGRCCKFQTFGHRLYVTTIELAAFIRQQPPAPRPSGLPILTDPTMDGCPYQLDGLCSVHAIRPFGCRIFFCDASAETWQQQTYEIFHARLKALHQAWNIPYFYIEWRQALAQIQSPMAVPPSP